jgi:hypothetical protein
MQETMAAGPASADSAKRFLRERVRDWLQSGFTSSYRRETDQVMSIVDGLVDSGYVARRARKATASGT